MAKDTEKDNKSKLLAALLTLLLGAGIVATLFVTSLHYDYPPKEALLQQMQEPIEFGGEDEEFVEFEQMLANADEESAEPGEPIEEEQPTQDNPPQEAGQNELDNQGAVDEPPQPPVSTKKESPMKVPEQPKKETKPQKKTVTPEEAPPKPKSKGETKPTAPTPPTTSPKSEAQTKAEQQMSNAFKKGDNGNAPGSTPNGTMGKPAIGGGLGGYTAEHFPTAPSPGPGTVVVQVVVSPTGKVTKATVTGGTLKSNAKACQICRSLALRSTFKVPKNTAVERTGTLTYTVK